MNSQNQQQTFSNQLPLPGVGDLLKRAFLVYKARLGTFLGIMILSLIPVLFLLIPLAILKEIPALGIFLLIIFLLPAIIFSFWVQLSLIFAIKDREEKIGVIESLRRGWPKIISFVWILFLAAIITTGGYLLFIIPGIIFSVWFAFSTYVLVSEDLRGMNALWRSKQLVTGYWWKVFWRLLAMGIVVALPIILIYAILAVSTSTAFANWFNRIISLLFVTPFTFSFEFLLYEDLKRQKAQILFEPPKIGTKIKFILIGIVGLLLIPAILASIVLISLKTAREKAREVKIIVEMIQLQTTVEMIYSKEGSYENLSCAHPQLISFCNNIKSITGKEAVIHSSKKAYCIYTELPGKRYYCLDSNYFKGKETSIFPGTPGYCDGVTFICP